MDSFTLTIVILLFIFLFTLVFLYYDYIVFIYVGLTKKRGITKKFKKECRKNNYLFYKKLVFFLDNGKFFEVDNLIIADKYIFIIDIIVDYGFLTGKFRDSEWISYKGQERSFTKNPLKDLEMKINKLSQLLNVSDDNFVGLSVFTKTMHLDKINCSKFLRVLPEYAIKNFIPKFEKSSPACIYDQASVKSVCNNIEFLNKQAKVYLKKAVYQN